MSNPAARPEVVQLPAETPVVAPARNRRAAAQRVREARDRLTSTSGTRPAFDRELLRQYAQTRLSASLVVVLLVVATGLLFGLLLQPLTAAIWTNDEKAAIRIGDQIDTGTWFMNRCDYLDPALAWTGVKDSGRGCTLSRVGYEHLTRPKSFHLRVKI